MEFNIFHVFALVREKKTKKKRNIVFYKHYFHYSKLSDENFEKERKSGLVSFTWHVFRVAQSTHINTVKMKAKCEQWMQEINQSKTTVQFIV